jgi:predicted Zn-dependent protease
VKFTPRRADDGVNVSRQHPLAEAGTLLAGVGVVVAAITVLLFFLVDIVLWFVPVEQEVALFDAWLPADIETVGHDDPRLMSLDELVSRLARHWPETAYDFRVEIDDSPDLNAMAFPGGLIVVTSGLLETVESENELAFVIGHEMGHFRNRDHIRHLGRGVAVSVLLAGLGYANANTGVSASIADLAARGFSRRQERKADEFGLAMLQAEYGHVAQAWRFFERIDAEGSSVPGLVSYLATHPSPRNRVERLVALAAENGWPASGPVTGLGWR